MCRLKSYLCHSNKNIIFPYLKKRVILSPPFFTIKSMHYLRVVFSFSNCNYKLIEWKKERDFLYFQLSYYNQELNKIVQHRIYLQSKKILLVTSEYLSIPNRVIALSIIFGIRPLPHFWYQFFVSFLVSFLCFIL